MIRFCKIGDESSSIDGIIQDEPLEYQGIGNGGFILRTRMEHPREYIEKCRQQILENQEKAEKWDSSLEYHKLAYEKVKELDQENKRLKDIETRIKKRIIELVKEDDEDLERTRKSFPRWSEEQVESCHDTENYCKMIISELKTTLEGN